LSAKTLYIEDVAASGFGSLTETQPSAANTGTGWTVAKLAAARFALMLYGTQRASGAFSTSSSLDSSTGPGSGSAWRTGLLTGQFSAGNWAFAFAVRPGTASTHAGRVRFRVWKSANADGSSATELTSGAVVGSATGTLNSTTTTETSSATWSAPAFTLANEYLFIQAEWETTAAGGSNQSSVLFRQGDATVVTTSFLPLVLASASQTLDTLSQSATATPLPVLFAATQTLDTLSQNAAAADFVVPDVGTYGAGDYGSGRYGVSEMQASADQTLPAPTQAATATIRVSASSSQTLAPPTQAATAAARVAASASQSLSPPQQAATVAALVSATAAQSLSPPTQTAAASVRVSLSTDQTLPAPTQVATLLLSALARFSADQTLPGPTQVAALFSVRVASSEQLMPPILLTGTLRSRFWDDEPLAGGLWDDELPPAGVWTPAAPEGGTWAAATANEPNWTPVDQTNANWG
jgi:hypothetical protein